MADKLCVFCDHLSLNCDVEHGYYEGDVYPSGTVHCLKGHWEIATNRYGAHGARSPYTAIPFGRGELAEAIQTAKTCADYSPPASSGEKREDK